MKEIYEQYNIYLEEITKDFNEVIGKTKDENIINYGIITFPNGPKNYKEKFQETIDTINSLSVDESKHCKKYWPYVKMTYNNDKLCIITDLFHKICEILIVILAELANDLWVNNTKLKNETTSKYFLPKQNTKETNTVQWYCNNLIIRAIGNSNDGFHHDGMKLHVDNNRDMNTIQPHIFLPLGGRNGKGGKLK